MLRKLKIGLLISGVLTILRAFGVELPGEGLLVEAVNESFPLLGFAAAQQVREKRSNLARLRVRED